jgi:molecular chaperone GrpE
LTSEGKKTGSHRKVEIQDAADPGDIEILHEEAEDEEEVTSSGETDEGSVETAGDKDPEWLRKLDSQTESESRGGESGPGEESGPEAESGKKKPKKTSKAELAEHLARKNEMLQTLKERLAEKEKALDIKEDRLMRLAAEFENYKKRTRQEWDLLKNQANAGLLKDILGVLDDLDRAFEHSNDSTEHFRDGITLIHTSLLELLGRNGLSEIEAVGKPFDPQYHEALAETSSEYFEEGIIAEVVQKGYMLNDQVIRPARVVVSRGSD